MKYTKIDKELPPLGELVIMKTDKNNVHLAISCVNVLDERDTISITQIKQASTECFTIGKNVKWAKLPKFRNVATEKPPIGVAVLFKSEHIDGQLSPYYHRGFLKKDGATVFDMGYFLYELTGWLPLDVFDEEPCPCATK